ncbi:MAG: serine hydrolase domain-containing protein [Acidimicrobiia bacterium]
MTIADPQSIADWLDAQHGSDQFSGAVLVRSGGETIFEHQAGWAHRGHRVPLRRDTRFQVASLTKMITAATALRLVEQGALSLDKPLTGFLPPDYRPTALDDRHTLRHLLSHTSGLDDYHDDDETWSTMLEAWDVVPVYRARGPKDLLPLFKDLPLIAEPGEFSYSDANFVLTGLLVEWITDKTFAQAATEQILIPAGMDESGFFELDLEPDDMATAYLSSDEPAPTWRSNVYSVPAGGMPDGGLISTPTDIDRFLTSLRSGKLLGSDTVSEVLSPLTMEEGEVEGYGLGMELVVEDGDVIIYGHGGAHPGVSAMVSHYVGPGVTVIVLCNQDRGAWAAAGEVARQLGLEDPRE